MYLQVLYILLHDCLGFERYQAVFGPTTESGSTDFDSRNGAAIEAWEQGEEEKMSADGKEGYKDFNYVHVGNSLSYLKTAILSFRL